MSTPSLASGFIKESQHQFKIFDTSLIDTDGPEVERSVVKLSYPAHEVIDLW